MINRRRPMRRKSLPLWVIVVAIAGAVGGLIAVFTLLPGEAGNDAAKVDPAIKTMERDYYLKCRKIDFFRRQRLDIQESLVKKEVVPKEWGEGNFVPWYDPKKGK